MLTNIFTAGLNDNKMLGLILKLKEFTNILLELGKVRITFFVAISTSVGFILYSGSIVFEMLLTSLAVFLLASGSSALNHYQEKESDALMERTKHRPIPAGRISSGAALLVSFLLIVIGAALLYFVSNFTALTLGILALIWYNLLYTPLKKKYSLAIVPGAIIGAIPPVIGWTAAGGNFLDYHVLVLALFFFIWQVPHFWLLLLIYGDQYEEAGFPTLTKIFNNKQLSRITYIWIVALSLSCLLMPLFSVTSNLITAVLFLIVGIWMVYKTKNILSKYLEKIVFRKAFITINVYVLIVVVLLSIDKLLFTNF